MGDRLFIRLIDGSPPSEADRPNVGADITLGMPGPSTLAAPTLLALPIAAATSSLLPDAEFAGVRGRPSLTSDRLVCDDAPQEARRRPAGAALTPSAEADALVVGVLALSTGGSSSANTRSSVEFSAESATDRDPSELAASLHHSPANLRISISATTMPARCRRMDSSFSLTPRSRGLESMVHSVPNRSIVDVTSGMPA